MEKKTLPLLCGNGQTWVWKLDIPVKRILENVVIDLCHFQEYLYVVYLL